MIWEQMPDRLSRISTIWTMLREAQEGAGEEVDETAFGGDEDRTFAQTWRDDLLGRTWKALAEAHMDLHAVLRFRTDHPDLRSAEMAREMNHQFGKKLTADAVRQALHRARELFGQLLLEEVAQSLKEPTLEEVEGELAELDLLEYVRPVLDRRQGGIP